MNEIATSSTADGKVKTLQILNTLGFVFMLVMNFLAIWLPLNGKTTGELSDQYANLFVPAGITFSIWGVIYLLLLVFTIYQASTVFNTKTSTVNTLVRRLGYWYFSSSLLNGLWILAWHYELLPVSVAIMLLLLLSLICVNSRITKFGYYLPVKERLISKIPFGIYLGWISVASIANSTAWLTELEWKGGLAQDTWTVVMIILGMLISLYASFRLQNGYLPLAVAWAFVGIMIKRTNQEEAYPDITYVAAAAAAVLLICSVIVLVRESPRKSIDAASPLIR